MIAYKYKNNVYLNITNRCTMKCPYCIKTGWKYKFRGCNLKLKKEPTYEQVLGSLRRAFRNSKIPRPAVAGAPPPFLKGEIPKKAGEVVFCGYGEPLLRLDLIKRVALYLKRNLYNVRINTNGHGNLIHKRNIIPELVGLIDCLYVSINAENAKKYFQIHKPVFGRKTFKSVLSFVLECKKYLPRVVVTAVEIPGVDVKKIELIAKKLDVGFLRRPYLT
ncbi:MAG: TatD family nuclease-associated radical SAM protein [Elusimicrobiota bacterium]